MKEKFEIMHRNCNPTKSKILSFQKPFVSFLNLLFIIFNIQNKDNLIIHRVNDYLFRHSHSRGKDNYNFKLSHRRAKSTKYYIISRGISPGRIESVTGFGESQLLNKCFNGVKCTPKELQLNRRSYFYLVKNSLMNLKSASH